MGEQSVDVTFESHPPIEEDRDGISRLLKQSLFNFVDPCMLANHVIHLKDLTQVIIQDTQSDESDSSNANEQASTSDKDDKVQANKDDSEETDEEDEPDNAIYGVVSYIDLNSTTPPQANSKDSIQEKLVKFLSSKSAAVKSLLESEDNNKLALLINERYINLPPQLALPALKRLSVSIKEANYTHLLLICKILLKSRDSSGKLQSKKQKRAGSSLSEPLVFINPEEEIICENAESFVDIDVSAQCDENATWSFATDVKYTPHRRILIIDNTKWPTIMSQLEKEIKV